MALLDLCETFLCCQLCPLIIQLIIFGAFFFVIFFFLPETRDTIIMSKKSKLLREKTGDMPFFAEHELVKKDPSHLWKVTIIRPFKFLFTEPITYLTAGINGFIFGMIFLSNEAFALVFGPGNNGHGWTRYVDSEASADVQLRRSQPDVWRLCRWRLHRLRPSASTRIVLPPGMQEERRLRPRSTLVVLPMGHAVHPARPDGSGVDELCLHPVHRPAHRLRHDRVWLVSLTSSLRISHLHLYEPG